MPLYTWVCDKCEAKVDVLRNFTGFGDPPTEDDPEVKREAPTCKGGGHEWKKIIEGTNWKRGGNWSGSKGNW